MDSKEEFWRRYTEDKKELQLAAEDEEVWRRYEMGEADSEEEVEYEDDYCGSNGYVSECERMDRFWDEELEAVMFAEEEAACALRPY